MFSFLASQMQFLFTAGVQATYKAMAIYNLEISYTKFNCLLNSCKLLHPFLYPNSWFIISCMKRECYRRSITAAQNAS